MLESSALSWNLFHKGLAYPDQKRAAKIIKESIFVMPAVDPSSFYGISIQDNFPLKFKKLRMAVKEHYSNNRYLYIKGHIKTNTKFIPCIVFSNKSKFKLKSYSLRTSAGKSVLGFVGLISKNHIRENNLFFRIGYLKDARIILHPRKLR